MFFTQIDIFGQSVVVENKLGQQLLYTIEQIDGIYHCFVQKRTSYKARWRDKKVVDSSQSFMQFEYAENESGFKLEKKKALSLNEQQNSACIA